MAAASTTPSPAGAGNTPHVADLGNALNSIVDETGAPATTYICEAPAGTLSSAAKWRVAKITVVGTITTTSYAGTGAFDQVADNRAALVY